MTPASVLFGLAGSPIQDGVQPSLRVVATDCVPAVALDLCAKCAPEYLRALAATVERGG